MIPSPWAAALGSWIRATSLVVLAATLTVAPPAAAQEPGEVEAPGPDVAEAGDDGIPGSAPAGEEAQAAESPPGQREVIPEAALPSGHPPVAAGGARGGFGDILGPRPPAAEAQASDSVPVGTIEVRVVDPEGQPVAGSPVDVGVLAQGDRSRHNGETDAAGIARFTDLPTGSGQAYRVNVPYLGATYSTTPFNLPSDRGFEVQVRRMPVTRDDSRVVQLIAATVVELKDERLHVIHQSQLANFGEETFVFPAEGLTVPLPEGFLAFQFQRVMTDQRIEEAPGEGYRIRGSLPPGQVSLAWAYDLPITGTRMQIPVQIPFRTFRYRVITEAAPGMSLAVSGMPPAQYFDNEGQPVWATEVQRAPTDPPFERVVLTVSGIPGPGPARWVAVGLAMLLLLGGAFFLFGRRQDASAAWQRARTERQEILLAQARTLEREHAAGEVGPEFRQKERTRIVRELAALLAEEQRPR